jgi:hypothetical protein
MAVSTWIYNVLKIRLKKQVVVDLKFVAGLEDGLMARMNHNIFGYEMVTQPGLTHSESENIFVS